jgi:hypothetical protein
MRTPHTYNATCEWFDANGQTVSLEMVQVVGGIIHRSNGHWTANNGTPEFHAEWLSGKMSFQDHYRLHMDDGARYLRRLGGR